MGVHIWCRAILRLERELGGLVGFWRDLGREIWSTSDWSFVFGMVGGPFGCVTATVTANGATRHGIRWANRHVKVRISGRYNTPQHTMDG